jgi:hypothetical protein
VSLALSGCGGPPAEVQTQAASVLTGNCLNKFLRGYYYAPLLASKAMALAVDEKTQVCGTFFNSYLMSEDVANKALLECEWYRKQQGMTAPCRLYARENEIVWNDPSRSISLPGSNPSPAPVAPAYNPPQQFIPSAETRGESLDSAKAKCADIGFKAGTQKFGECVLKLSK